METQQRYVLIDADPCWFAYSRKSRRSGHLFFNKGTGKYSAFLDEKQVLFPKLAKGNRKDPRDSPVHLNHEPKADFLILLALRETYSSGSPGRDQNPERWRVMALLSKLRERAADPKAPLQEDAVNLAEELSHWDGFFDAYVGSWLATLVQKPGAGAEFRRLAAWLDAIDRLVEDGIPEDYQRFFKAVESAAQEAGGVPPQKEVKVHFQKGMSENLLGQGHRFRDTMRRLKFDWLPTG